MSPMVPTRTVSAMTSVETPSSAATAGFGRMRISGRFSGAVDSGFERCGDRPHLALQLRRRLDDEVLVGPADDQLQRPQAVGVERDEANIRHVPEHAGDALLELALPKLALGLRHIGDREGREAHLLLARQLHAAVDEDGAHFRHLAQTRRKPVGHRLGVVEARSGRQLGDEEGAALVARRQEAVGEELRRVDRAREERDAEQEGQIFVPHRPADEPGIGAHDDAVLRLLVHLGRA